MICQKSNHFTCIIIKRSLTWTQFMHCFAGSMCLASQKVIFSVVSVQMTELLQRIDLWYESHCKWWAYIGCWSLESRTFLWVFSSEPFGYFSGFHPLWYPFVQTWWLSIFVNWKGMGNQKALWLGKMEYRFWQSHNCALSHELEWQPNDEARGLPQSWDSCWAFMQLLR